MRGKIGISDPVVLSNGNIGCLFECGEMNPYERIDFINLTLK